MGVHCFAHETNLDVLVISELSLVACLEALFQVLYGFFSHSPRDNLEF
jgi:hypothetical protein